VKQANSFYDLTPFETHMQWPSYFYEAKLFSSRDEVKNTWSYTSTPIGRHGVHWVTSPFPLS